MVIVERIERRTLIIVTALGIATLGLVFGFAQAPWLILPRTTGQTLERAARA